MHRVKEAAVTLSLGREGAAALHKLTEGWAESEKGCVGRRGIANLSEEVDAVSAAKRDGYRLLRSVLRLMFIKEVNRKLGKVQKSHRIDLWADKFCEAHKKLR